MVTADEEISLAYLLDPTFQLVNTAGKPLTDGWLEVYIHGTRNKYYCYSDWNGTLLPFKIPLDSLGANIVLASPAHSYDVYVYNRFGSLVMSRYNVVPATGDGSVIKDVVVITSNDGTVDVSTSDQTNWDLSIKDTVDQVAENTSDIGDIKDDIDDINDAIDDINDSLADKKDKQTAKSFDGAATKTVKKITQDANGEMNVEFEDIDLPPEVPNVEITSEDNSVQVTETTDVQTNTKTFNLSVNVDDPLEYGQFRATNVTTQAQLAKIKGNLELDNYSIKLKKGNSYHFTVRGSYVATSAANTATTISYIEYSSFTNIPVNVDNTITDPQYFEISYDVYNYGQNSAYNVSFASMLSGKVSELWVEVHNLNGVSVNGSGVSNIVIAREYNGVIDDTYDGMKIRQTDNGNEIVALRKNNNWYSFGQLAPLSAGSDKILITDSNGTVHWGVVGTGLEIDNDTLEVSISSEVGDVVETVEKLGDDLDKKITTTYPFAQITSMSDFATYGVSNTTRMIGQLFAVPIASEIRKDETVICVNALQNFSGNVSFGIFEYDFEGNGGTGSTYWVADTGTVSVRAGENEFSLKYVLNDAHELQSSKLYYAVIAIAANAPATGLLLGSSPAYAQNVNANPKYTLIVSNMDNYIDWSVGTLQGAWFQEYNEQYDIPRLFMMLRNGEGSTPIPVTEPFTDIGTFTLEHQYRVSNIFSLTPDANGAVYRKIIPAQDVDIASFRYVDYHGSISQSTGFPVLLDDTYTPMQTQADGTWTLGDSDQTKVDGTHYVHEFTFTTPVHLTANTAYWFVVGGNLSNQGSDWLITYQTPSVTNDLLLVKNMYNVNSWIIPNSGEFIAAKPGMYLQLSDGTDSWTI